MHIIHNFFFSISMIQQDYKYLYHSELKKPFRWEVKKVLLTLFLYYETTMTWMICDMCRQYSVNTTLTSQQWTTRLWNINSNCIPFQNMFVFVFTFWNALQCDVFKISLSHTKLVLTYVHHVYVPHTHMNMVFSPFFMIINGNIIFNQTQFFHWDVSF